MLPEPIDPLPPDAGARPRSELFAALTRIDGWGELAWREAMGAWRIGGGALVLERREGDDDPWCTLVCDRHALGPARDAADAAATADWVLARCWRTLIPTAPIRVATDRPGEALRALTACHLHRGRIVLRLAVRLPSAGMCVDGARFARFVRGCERFLRALAVRARRPDLTALRRAVAVQQALRAALPTFGLVAFVGDGARLARAPGGGPAADCRPLRIPRALAVTIDLGALGRVRGLGIRRGITVVTGAPYHGKSTLVQAIAAGREDHRPGDGRERVVTAADAVAVQAEDGRRIVAQDLTPFFARLPGGDARAFTTARASGATSMAASALQAVAAGSRLLVIDEDTAAANFLAIDPALRRLLGASARGTRTLIEALPAFSALGVSTLLAIGSATPAFAVADRVLLLTGYQPRDITPAARRLVARPRRASLPLRLPPRRIAEPGDPLLGPRHLLRIDAREPERPRLRRERDELVVDLRRAGWELDDALARGALCGAAWAIRLAQGRPLPLAELGARFAALIAAHGPRALDPFDATLLAAPPWQLVVSVLERMPGIGLDCRAR